MPVGVKTVPCPFCEKEPARQDNINTHILSAHTIEQVLAGGPSFKAQRHPVKQNIVIVRNNSGKEVLGYCFECYTRVKAADKTLPSKAALSHRCCSKKAAVDDVPTLSIAEVAPAAPVVSDSLPEKPAAPRGIDWEAAVRSLLPEKRATALKRCYDEEMDWITENMEGDVSHLDWRGMIIDAIADRTELVAFQKECQEKLTAAQERVVFAEQRAAAAEAMTCHHQKQSLADKLAVEQMCDALHASETHNRELQKRLNTRTS